MKVAASLLFPFCLLLGATMLAQPAEAEVLSGRVLYAQNHAPAARIGVNLLLAGQDQPLQRISTDIHGSFLFLGLQQGTYVVEVAEKGYNRTCVAVQVPSSVPVTILVELEPADVHEASKTTVSVRELQIPRKARKEFEKGVHELYGKQRPAHSLYHFRKAIELYPDYEEAYIQLGGVHYGQAQYAEARELLEEAIEIDPESARAWTMLGIAYSDAGQAEKSLQALQQAVKLDTNNWHAHGVLGNIFLEMNQIEESYRHASRAHELQPHAPTVQILLHNVCLRCEEYEVALRELEEFLVLHPGDPWTPEVRRVRDRLRRFLEARNREK